MRVGGQVELEPSTKLENFSIDLPPNAVISVMSVSIQSLKLYAELNCRDGTIEFGCVYGEPHGGFSGHW